MAKKSKLTKRKFLKMSPAELGKLKQAEARELLKGARQLFNAQASTFRRYEGTVFSPAFEKMESYYQESGTKSIRSMTNNQLRAEIFRLQEFFKAKTSTVPGARKVASEQDARIFGVDKKGRPKKRFTTGERAKFWAAYGEFKNLLSESELRNMGSNTIQQVLVQYMTEDDSGSPRKGRRRIRDFSIDLFNKVMEEVRDRIREEQWETDGYDFDSEVFSGKRDY